MTNQRNEKAQWNCSYCGYDNEIRKKKCIKCKNSKKIWQMLNKTKKKYY